MLLKYCVVHIVISTSVDRNLQQISYKNMCVCLSMSSFRCVPVFSTNGAPNTMLIVLGRTLCLLCLHVDFFRYQ